MIAVVACSDYDRWHVRLVEVTGRLLLNLDRASHDYAIVIDQITLVEKSGLRHNGRHILGYSEQLCSDCVGILHEKAKPFAGGEVPVPHGAQALRAQPAGDALGEAGLLEVGLALQLLQHVDATRRRSGALALATLRFVARLGSEQLGR